MDDETGRKLLAQVAELTAMVKEQQARLSKQDESVIVRHKMQAATARPVRQLGRPAEVKHPFRSHLNRIGSDVATWARQNTENPSTVKAWMRGDRKIPDARAHQIQNEAGKDASGRWLVPATTATWPRGLKT